MAVACNKNATTCKDGVHTIYTYTLQLKHGGQTGKLQGKRRMNSIRKGVIWLTVALAETSRLKAQESMAEAKQDVHPDHRALHGIGIFEADRDASRPHVPCSDIESGNAAKRSSGVRIWA